MTLSGLIQLIILSVAGFIYLKDWEARDSGNTALGIAKFIAATPMVNDALQNQNPRLIQNEIELLRSSINAAFIVVGDINGIRYSHPVAERIGPRMQGWDLNQKNLDGYIWNCG